MNNLVQAAPRVPPRLERNAVSVAVNLTNHGHTGALREELHTRFSRGAARVRATPEGAVFELVRHAGQDPVQAVRVHADDLASPFRYASVGYSRPGSRAGSADRVAEARRAAFYATLRQSGGPATVEEFPMEEGLVTNQRMSAAVRAVLDPVAGQPEFLRTLHLYLACDRDRHRVARRLGVHTRTVDYRIRRVGQLCGRHPQSVADSVHLLGALVAKFVHDEALWPT